MDQKLSPLFTPWKIGNCEIKNRFVLTSMGGTLAQEPVHPSAARPGLRWILIVPRPSPSGSAA